MAVPPPQNQPPALTDPDELVEEILLRLPSDKPAQLVRAALVCKRWCRLVMDPGFGSRFRQLHRTPPMLGLIVRCCSPATTTTRFVPTSSFYPYDAVCRTWSPLDARHGRILFYHKDGVGGSKSNPARNELNVWTPVTGEVHKLPKLWLPCSDRHFVYWNAALLSRTPGCNHMECPFTVVLVGGNVSSLFTHAYVYSSEANEWTQTASIEDCRYVQHHCSYSALVGNALYFLLRCNSGILEYDLAKKELSVIGLPPICKVSTAIVLMSMKDDGLGFAMVHDDLSLCIWLRESAPTPGGGWTWAQHRVVDLKSFLPVSAISSTPYVAAAVDAVGVFIIRAGRVGDVLAIDLKSGHVWKIPDANSYILDIIPYITFCTPALRAVAIDEGPSMGASNNT